MLENIKVYTSDNCWKHILTDLGLCVVDAPDVADVILDDVDKHTPVSVDDLCRLILSRFNNDDIIQAVFGAPVELPVLQRKIIVALYKHPNITMADLKQAVGLSPDVTTHSVENAIYQLRKIYGHDFIQNLNGGYKIGRI